MPCKNLEDGPDEVSRCFSYYPQLYLHKAECGDYLNPGFLRQIEHQRVSTIFEVGCADGADTLRLAAVFPAYIHAFECNPYALIEARRRCASTNVVRFYERAVSESLAPAIIFYKLGSLVRELIQQFLTMRRFNQNSGNIPIRLPRAA